MPQETLGYVQLEWTCPKCQSRNPGTATTCQGCGAPQPAEVKFEQVQGEIVTQDEKLKKLAEVGPDIHCPYCGARNPGDAAVCVQCGGDLSAGARRAAGQVVGAYAPTEVRTIACPRCQSPNPETNLRCANCGAPLTLPQTVSAAAPQAKAPAANWLLYAAIAIILLCLCGGGALLLSKLSRSTDVAASVAGRQWRSAVQIEALAPVKYQDWQDQIPSQAAVGECQTRVRQVVDREPIGQEARKICGTPYTVDTGSGVGKVVQDCQYEVMAPYCQYTLMQWAVVQTLTQQGSDAAPVFAQASLANGQREGERSLSYQVVFRANDRSYEYSPASKEDYLRFTPGSEWLLTVNGFDQIVAVQPRR